MTAWAATSPAELLAVGAGCVVFFVLDLIISAFSVAVEEGTSLWDAGAAQRRPAGRPGVRRHRQPRLPRRAGRPGAAPWASLLLAVPLATILIASQALSRGGEQRRRLTSLFDASGAIFGASSGEEVLTCSREHAEAGAGPAADRAARRAAG